MLQKELAELFDISIIVASQRANSNSRTSQLMTRTILNIDKEVVIEALEKAKTQMKDKRK